MGCMPSILQRRDDHEEDELTNNTGGSGGGGGGGPWKSRGNATEKNKSSRSKVAKNAAGQLHAVLRTARSSDSTTQYSGTQAKVLLVFPKSDFHEEALYNAADKLHYECCVARTKDAAIDIFNLHQHDIVIIDNRYPRQLDGERLCRDLRAIKATQYTIIVAVVKRSRAENDDPVFQSFLAAGYNRIIVETSSMGMCMNELMMLEKSDLAPRMQLATVQAVYLALDHCKNIVHITDSNLKLQFINRVSERVMGHVTQEVMGKTITEVYGMEIKDTTLQDLQKGRQWDGITTCRTRSGDSLTLTCNIAPSCHADRPPTHYVFVYEPPSLILDKRLSQPNIPYSQREIFNTESRGSISSLRKGSMDVRSVNSEGHRRQSLAKLHSLPIEAPITNIITLITMAQEEASEQVAQILDRVVDMLKSTELYRPHIKETRIRPGDPVTSDLITALLTQGGSTSISVTRRSSSESSNYRAPSVISGSAPKPTKYLKAPAQIRDLLESSLQWEFDIFKLEDMTAKRPLVHLGMNLFLHFNSHHALGCEETTLLNWLTIIELNYNSSNTYHNSTHAADVMQATAGFLMSSKLKQIFDPLDEAVCLISAAAHDVNHPGKSSAFLCNSDNELAILYNDISVLESHHAALCFKLTMSDERVNIFKGLERDMYKVVRQNIIDMILATEMTKHFEHLAKFVSVFGKTTVKDELTGLEMTEPIDITFMSSTENLSLIKRMLIKCADVSNPTRPIRFSVEWAVRIAEEYFRQTEEEKINNLPIVMPMFDRTTCSIPKSQIGFMDFIINDMFRTWEGFIEMPYLISYMERNLEYWKEQENKGINSIQDVITNQKNELPTIKNERQ